MRYYQLTHDYLVHSIRDWLTRKQKETRRGRAELLLADRAGVWNARPENRQLPSLLQWLQIWWLTAKKNWTQPHRKMMGKAGRYHAVRGLVVAVVLALIGWGGYETHGTLKAHALRDRLLDANTLEVSTIVQDMAPYRRWINPLLRDPAAQAEASKDARKQLHASLALLPVDATQVYYLSDRLLEADPPEIPVIRDALAPHKDELVERLWSVVEKPEKGKEQQRLRAACALASYDVADNGEGTGRWNSASNIIADELLAAVQKNPSHYATLLDQLRPVRSRLLPPLTEVYRNKERPDSERAFATNILAAYAADNPHLLADLVMDANPAQFAVIFPKFKEQSEQGLPVLRSEIDKKLPADLPFSDKKREKLAKRQANAAVVSLRMNQPEKVWPLLKHSPDPRVRSYLIHRFSPLGADARAIIKRLEEEPDITIQRALILSLGEYGERELLADERGTLVTKLQEIYRTSADPGLHGASEWLLRSWKEDAWLKKLNEEWKSAREKQEKRLESVKQLLAMEREKTPPQWYVNGQGQTMVVIPGPVEFMMGSPVTEADRRGDEPQHKKRIGRTFAVAAKLVTVEQYRKFDRGHQLPAVYTRTADLPAVGTSWYQAAAYCNFLSKEEGIPEEELCYETDAKGQVTKLKANYLIRSGYRLPTEAEMEYATRAGAVTARYFGETDELLPKYAWYGNNSQEKTWPVGSLKPNDLGFFDVQGNAFNWCQESFKRYPNANEVSEDKEDDPVIVGIVGRVLRGGSRLDRALHVRSALRNNNVPTLPYTVNGFRPARTLPLGPLTALPPTPYRR